MFKKDRISTISRAVTDSVKYPLAGLQSICVF